MQNLDFKLLINAFDTPTLIASQTILNQNISKYEILYANNQFFEYFPNGSKNFKYLSDFENINGYTWKELSQRAFITKNKVEEIFYSKEKECLTTISFSYLDDKSIIITLKPHSDSDKKNDYTDELTKLPNRKSFSSDLNKIIDYSTENNKKFALLLIDIDDIKSINSSQGFEAGDLLLVRVATILKRFEKNNIYTYRFGADEFLIVIKDFDIIDSLATITDTIFEVLNYEGVSISGGISIFPDHSKTKDDLLKFANIAKNNAKKRRIKPI